MRPIEAAVECPEVPRPIEYAVLRAPVDRDTELPLVYVLHGGGDSRAYLSRVAPVLESGWADRTLPPFVAVTPSASGWSFYMNLHDGSERWEDALTGSFLEHVRRAHRAKRERAMVIGPSMGGLGGLRLAFRRPDVIAAVAALEPGLQPALDFDHVELRDRYWMPADAVARAYGDPVDRAWWRANNPASIAHDDPNRLRSAGLAIYLECGDDDAFEMYRGTEFLHRVLFDGGIAHEYRLVRGADHIGASVPARLRDALGFLAKVIDPPPPDPALPPFREQVARMRREAGVS